MAETAVDTRAFREICGRFATGVTVVTMRVADEPHGLTANAFSSVSLDPPLVLVCVDRAASVHDQMERAGAFAVNILSSVQRGLAEFFATHGRGDGGDHMGGFPHRPGATGAPLLDGTLGWLDCRVWNRYDGGDHTIVVGEVVDVELTQTEGSPLLFFGGAYRGVDSA